MWSSWLLGNLESHGSFVSRRVTERSAAICKRLWPIKNQFCQWRPEEEENHKNKFFGLHKSLLKLLSVIFHWCSHCPVLNRLQHAKTDGKTDIVERRGGVLILCFSYNQGQYNSTMRGKAPRATRLESIQLGFARAEDIQN